MLKRALLIFIVSCCGIAAIAQAQNQQTIYKWTDEQGKVRYSELPPTAGIPFETVRKSAAQGKELRRDLAKDPEELARQAADQKQKEEQQQAEQKQKEADTRAKNCEIAKKNIQNCCKSGRCSIQNTKGTTALMLSSAQQRCKRLKKIGITTVTPDALFTLHKVSSCAYPVFRFLLLRKPRLTPR